MKTRTRFVFTVSIVCLALGLILSGCSDDDDDSSSSSVLSQFRCESPGNAVTLSNPLSQLNIINGESASIGDWPWMAALVYRGESAYEGFHCGGILVHPNWVLTAAHCVDSSPVDVVLGTESLTSLSSGAERIAVVEKIRHPNYNVWTVENDVALYRLETPSTKSLASIDWNDRGQDGVTAQVAGWGSIDPDGTIYPASLRQVRLPIISNSECIQSLADYFSVSPDSLSFSTSGMLCAGYAEGGKDSCSGDSGGPLLVDGYITGLVSWGPSTCADPGGYGVYTRVSNYTPWISSIICSREVE